PRLRSRSKTAGCTTISRNARRESGAWSMPTLSEYSSGISAVGSSRGTTHSSLLVGTHAAILLRGVCAWAVWLSPRGAIRDEPRWIPDRKLSGSLQPFEKEYFRKDGGCVPLLIGVAAFEESGSQGVAYVLDLTERRRAQDALNRASAELARVSRVTALSALT